MDQTAPALPQAVNEAKAVRVEQEAIRFIQETIIEIARTDATRIGVAIDFAAEIHDHAKEHGLTYGELALAGWFLVLSTLDAKDEFESQSKGDTSENQTETQESQTEPETGC